MKRTALIYTSAILMLVLSSPNLLRAAGENDSAELASRLKKAGAAVKRNCVVSAALLNGDKRVPLKVVINGDDFASSVANETWFIHAQGHDWISDNGGKNWRATGPDPALCNLVLAPLTPSVSARDGYQPWRVESLGIETVNGEQRLHLRLRPPGQQNVANDDVPNYWLASDGKGGWVIRRFVGAVVFMNSALSVDAVYDHIGLAAKINPPVRP